MKLAALAVLTTLGLGGVALADPARIDRPGPPRGELRQLLLERFDRNHDGRLEPKERRHAIRALRRLAHRLAVQERRLEYRGEHRRALEPRDDRRLEYRGDRPRAQVERSDGETTGSPETTR